MLPGTRPPFALAVLPFSSSGSDPEFDYFADAFSGELARALGRLPGLRVAARASSRAFRERTAEPGEIRSALGVEHMLRGGVMRAGTRLRVAARLVTVADGSALWAERFDRDLGDVIAIQEAIVRGVVSRLGLPAVEPRRYVSYGTARLDAYELYLRGRSVAALGRASLERGVECFERALAIDPEFGTAHAALAAAAVALCVYGFTPAAGLAARARAAAARALALGCAHDEAHLALATLAILVDWNAEAASRSFQDAIAAAPHDPDVRAWHAWLHVFAGRAADAVEEGRRAVDWDPLSPIAHGMLALVHVLARQPADALAAGERAVAVDSASFMAHRALAAAHLIAGNLEAARPELDQAVLLSRRHQWCLSELAVVCGQLGDLQTAEALHEELVGRSTHEYVQRFVLAQTAAALGRLEDAFRLLGQAVKLREPLPLIRLWPYLDSIRDHPRFRAIVTQS